MSFESKYMSVEQYLRRISGQEKELHNVDHSYVKPWNAHPDSHRTKPARLLFMKGLQRYPQNSINENEEIDVDTCEEPIASPFDNQRAKHLANECEKNLKFSSYFSDVERKEEELDLEACSSNQKKLYQQVVNALNHDRLAKLTVRGTPNEPMKRRISTDKAARRIRQIFGLVFWDIKLLSWLHKILLNSDFSLLSSYIEILQTLRGKVPTLVDRILHACTGFAANDAVVQIMKKTWDPVLPILSQNKPKKLPGNAVILICPSSPNHHIISSRSPRLRFWHSNLSSICKVMNVHVNLDSGKTVPSIEECLEQIMSSVRNKVTELKNHYPNKPIILLGWTIGGLIACHVALQTPVDGVICLGFPLTGVNGSRGDLNDPLLDNQVPTLFVVGQHASMCSTDDVEDFRSRMRAETGLVIVGGADDMLRMCPVKMKQECVTQPIVDRCLLDEVSDFLMSIVVKLPSTSASTSIVSSKTCTPIIEEEPEQVDKEWKPEDDGKRKRRKPREYSPELSPVRKRPKHHASKQIPSAHKARRSPSSSDTSSSGSYANEKARSSKKVKKSDKRGKRPAVRNWRKRSTSKAPNQTPKTLQDVKNVENFRKRVSIFVEDDIPLPKPTKEVPFSKNLLPKKNDPVDVEKAFGCDSSFLPRPLTSPEPEDTVDTISAEETEEAMAELEAMAKEPSDGEFFSKIDSNISDSVSAIKGITFSSILDQPIKNSIAEGMKNSSITPATSTNADVKSSQAVTVSPTIQTVFPQSKFFSTKSLGALKTSGGISILASKQSSSQTSSKATVITVPSPSAASILVSSSALHGSNPSKMIQLVKGSLINKNQKSEAPSSSGESSEPQSCNLSLLSDVAGMTEQLIHKKPETHSATLVKLAASDRTQFPPLKCLNVVKAAATTPPARVETAEEMIEKQLAIQALNKSIGVEAPSTSKESGYSICYTKADGTVVSHVITRPTHPTPVPKPNIIATLGRGRGRGRPSFSGNPFKFCD